MSLKIALGLALAMQVIAAAMALRLNHRYRVHRAWLFISAAAILMAVLRLTSLMNVWYRIEEASGDRVLWTHSLASLTISLLMLAGMALIEPLFQQIDRANRLLQRQNRQLVSAVEATAEEMRLARQIQQFLLPSQHPNWSNLEIAGFSRPADWTSGDYFDYLALANDRLGVLIADASGHGTGAALMMSTTRGFLRAFAGETDDPGQLLTRVNRGLARDAAEGGFVTAFLVTFDEQGRGLAFAGAGHSAWLILQDGSHRELRGSYPPLGVVVPCELLAEPCPQLHSGDMLLLVSDGILEARGPGGMLGAERLLDHVVARRYLSSAEIAQSVLRLTEKHTAGEQHDDTTAVVVKVTSPSGNTP